MNPQTGEIVEVPEGQPAPRGFIPLTREQASTLIRLPLALRLRKWDQMLDAEKRKYPQGFNRSRETGRRRRQWEREKIRLRREG